MTEEPRNITVKLRKAGWEAEITCSESQLKQAIDAVLTSLGSQGMPSPSQAMEDEGTTQGNKTCRGLIVEMWRDWWFSEGRSLAQVHEEIARRGYHYDRTAVSHALRDLVLENILTREGNSRSYSYIQKRPPNASPTASDKEGASSEPKEQITENKIHEG